MRFTSDLKPCPFCGSKHVAYDGYAIHCGNCSAVGPFAATEEKAIEIWNERAGRLADDNHTPVDMKKPSI